MSKTTQEFEDGLIDLLNGLVDTDFGPSQVPFNWREAIHNYLAVNLPKTEENEPSSNP